MRYTIYYLCVVYTLNHILNMPIHAHSYIAGKPLKDIVHVIGKYSIILLYVGSCYILHINIIYL